MQIPYTIADVHGNRAQSVLTIVIDPEPASPEMSGATDSQIDSTAPPSALPQTGTMVFRLFGWALGVLALGALFVLTHRIANRSQR